MRIIVYMWPNTDIFAMKLFGKKLCVFVVYMYYTHPGYQTSVFGKNRAYYIRIFMAYDTESNVMVT